MAADLDNYTSRFRTSWHISLRIEVSRENERTPLRVEEFPISSLKRLAQYITTENFWETEKFPMGTQLTIAFIKDLDGLPSTHKHFLTLNWNKNEDVWEWETPIFFIAFHLVDHECDIEQREFESLEKFFERIDTIGQEYTFPKRTRISIQACNPDFTQRQPLCTIYRSEADTYVALGYA